MRYLIMCMAVVLYFCNVIFAQQQNSNTIVVFPFNFNNSQQAKNLIEDMNDIIERKLYNEKKYNMIHPDKANLLKKIQNAQFINKHSKDDATHIGSLFKIDYIIMGDAINDKHLIIKLIDIKREEIIYNKVYNLKKYTKEKLMQTIANNIDKKIEGYSFTPYNLYARYSYFEPMKDLADTIVGGHGAGAGFAYELPWVPNLLFGGEISYYYLTGKTNITHHATIMPMMFNIQYRLNYDNWYVTPTLSAGTSFNVLYYYIDMSINNDYVKRSSYNKTCKAGCMIGYSFNQHLSVFGGMEYGLYTVQRDNQFTLMNLGVRIVY